MASEGTLTLSAPESVTMAASVCERSSPSGWTVTTFSTASLASAPTAVTRCLPSSTEALARRAFEREPVLRLHLDLDGLRAFEVVAQDDGQKYAVALGEDARRVVLG